MEKYEILNEIGHGNFGKIYKIRRNQDNKILIWKELDYSQMSSKEKEQIVTEVNILRELDHPNIVKYYERVIDKKNSKIYIIMEYCEGGDISHLIKSYKNKSQYIPEPIIWKIFTQVLKAVHAIHTHKQGKIIHRDIKPSNIFLDKNNNIKLGDFGLSRILPQETTFAYSHVGTPYYMSPEQIEETKYNEKSDIWSLGCFLYEMAALRPPFQAKNQIMLGMRIKSGKIERIDKMYSNELWKCICLMMNINYEKRPSTSDLMKIHEIKVRIKEEEIEMLFENIKALEEKLKNKEIELNLREKELNDRENKLNEIEKNNYLKENELNEKEKNLIELEKKLKMSTSTWYSNNSRLKSSNNSDINNTYNNNFVYNMSPNLNTNKNFSSINNNELENFLSYTNNTNNNKEININISDSNKLSKSNTIYHSLENIVNTYTKNYTNRANLNYNYINKKQYLTQSKSVANCFSSAKNIINFENLKSNENKTNKSTTIEISHKNENNINNNTINIKNKDNSISLFSPVNTSKNRNVINFNSGDNLKINPQFRNKPSPIGNNILTNGRKFSNNLSNLINYSSLLSNMSSIKPKKFTIKINTNANIKKNIEEQKNNSNYKRPRNKISLIKNTKKNLSKLQQILNRSNTPRMNNIPTKLEYKDNGTYSNYIYNSKNIVKYKEKNNEKSFGNILTNIKRQNININDKEAKSLKSCVNLKKNIKSNNNKNITYRSNSSFNILNKGS